MKYISILFIALFLTSCSDDGGKVNETFKVKELLTDITNQRIVPSVQEFVNQSNLLNDYINNYATTTSETNLELLREQWKVTALAYENIYVFNIGVVRDRFTHRSIYNWPVLPNAVEEIISNNTDITQEFVESISNQSKSLAAIEYLLYKSNLTDTNTEFLNSEKRINFLKYSVLEMNVKANTLLNVWKEDGENYAATFINSDETGIQGSFNKLYNGIYNTIDTGKVTKIGKPAGLENSQVLDPEITQAYFSGTSLDLLKQNIRSVENIYFNQEGLGVADYVVSITRNDELNNAIQNKINEVYSAIDAIPVSLHNAITTNHGQVENLHQKLNELGVLFSVDVRSTLSIIITSTDNDGD